MVCFDNTATLLLRTWQDTSALRAVGQTRRRGWESNPYSQHRGRRNIAPHDSSGI